MNVIDELQMYLEEANNLINLVTSEDELDTTKNLFIGKKGKITGISKKLGTLEIEERKIVGQKINSLTQKQSSRHTTFS